jgi:hypothetical protein
MTDYTMTVPGSAYMLNAERYSIEIRVQANQEAFLPDPGYSAAENEAVLSGEAHIVDVTVTVFRLVLGGRVPIHAETFRNEVYGSVDDELVTPVPHPLTPMVMDVALSAMVDDGGKGLS